MTNELPTNTEDIPTEECWELLKQHHVARLAVVHRGEPDIFPISYVVDHGGIVFRTGAGTKLAAARSHPIALEVDGEDTVHGLRWSVVLRGHASRLEGSRPFSMRRSAASSPCSPDRSRGWSGSTRSRSPADAFTWARRLADVGPRATTRLNTGPLARLGN